MYSKPYQVDGDLWPVAAKIIEETSELSTVLAKLMATGGLPMYFDGTYLPERIEEEIADSLAAIELFMERNAGLVNRTAIEIRKNDKLGTLRSYI